MMTNRARGAIVSAGFVIVAALSIALAAQQQTTRKTKWSAQHVLPMTCAQAWVASGKNYQGMLEIVETLARVSLTNRDLTFPNTREAGLNAGRGIADDCKADPNGLLFAFVDKQVRDAAERAADR